jgi:hypothetical protein
MMIVWATLATPFSVASELQVWERIWRVKRIKRVCAHELERPL